ncbi:uncharacterized protein P174DRAFT_492700 [Aspergillus novofumigatus IBT 16806]|uniref:DUF2406 domain protein n=1 Tax=Aspergillus novofumigatus (strain IBT 16806) TaxID=1392255 RepID=A0A2I1C2R8_ASPN1|nr:uncharacterized protein P174DRAFT_492700 [Aspergillus novofumigatus IBT 16806]PKX91881.1 hypothetical protein P174DRAFT_492700 [Aspergillus novofumigatus IBT 16806]
MAPSQTVASPRPSRGFSFGSRSDKSRRSSNAASNKISLRESSEEKHRRSLHTKADPTLAMSEAQPMAVALEQSTLGSLRAMQHKDRFGQIIILVIKADPDLSNPTRPRFERPLETIRAFEAAFEGTYSSRPVSWARTESPNGGEHNKRGSYYGESSRGNGYYPNRGYSDQSGHFNQRATYSRPESYVDTYNGQPQDNGYYPYNQGGGGRRPRPNPRMYTDQTGYSNGSNGYAQHSYEKSVDNITAASGSGGSHADAWGNSTDPSSVNSSIDQLSQQLQLGQRGFNSQLNLNGYAPTPPKPPVHNFNQAPAFDPNAGGPVGGTPAAVSAPNRRQLRKSVNMSDTGDKRKSWFKRKFSKD